MSVFSGIRYLAFATTLISSAAGRPAGAQVASQAVVRAFVVDSAGAAVTNAELTVLRGLANVLARGTTDRFGRATLRFQAAPGDYDLVVRKIGYSRSDRFFSIESRDTLSLSVVVPPPAARPLDAVKVTAQADLKTRVYSIDADAIAASTRPLSTAWDIITKLRPDMAGGRAPCGTDPINLWVNGERIRFVPPDEMAMQREHIKRAQAVAGIYDVLFALYEIRPEHIAEMRFHDCFDTSVPDVGGSNALFVVLKQGVVYSPGEGSYVIEKWPPE